jgi:DNA-binding CsgD family transcriptional regulator
MFTKLTSNFQKTAVSTILKYFLEMWSFLYKDVQPIKIDHYVENIKMLDLVSTNKNTGYFLMDSKTLKLLYCSENFEEATSYLREDLIRDSTKFFFEMIEKKQLIFFFQFMKWVNHILKHITVLDNAKEYLQYQWVGLNIKHKKGHLVRTLFKVKPLEFDENGFHRLVLFTFENVTHLMKEDSSYWARVEIGKTKKMFSSFFHNDTKLDMKDVISERELEIIRLIATGKDTKEISELLFLSPHTVARHRKNIIARLGVRDSIALLEICKMCNLI